MTRPAPTYPLGRHQRELLARIANPTAFLAVGNRWSDALLRRRLAKAHGDHDRAMIAITPEGLRAPADELEAGRIAQRII